MRVWATDFKGTPLQTGPLTSKELPCKQDLEGKEEVGGLRIFYLVFEVTVLFKKTSLI